MPTEAREQSTHIHPRMSNTTDFLFSFNSHAENRRGAAHNVVEIKQASPIRKVLIGVTWISLSWEPTSVFCRCKVCCVLNFHVWFLIWIILKTYIRVWKPRTNTKLLSWTIEYSPLAVFCTCMSFRSSSHRTHSCGNYRTQHFVKRPKWLI